MCSLNNINFYIGYITLQNCTVKPLQMLWLVNWNLTSQDPLNTELMAEGWEHMENVKYQQGSQVLTIFVETNLSYISDILPD